MPNEYHTLFVSEIKRRLIDECQDRILKCLDLLSEEDIWYRPNTHSNSVGNLVLHLCGNVTQWLLSTLGGEPDNRLRRTEFETQVTFAREVLKSKIVVLMSNARGVIDRLEPDDLLKTYSVQGYRESGIAILLHITEHFSYHVGQITYFIKARRDLDVGYYHGKNLDATR